MMIAVRVMLPLWPWSCGVGVACFSAARIEFVLLAPVLLMLALVGVMPAPPALPLPPDEGTKAMNDGMPPETALAAAWAVALSIAAPNESPALVFMPKLPFHVPKT